MSQQYINPTSLSIKENFRVAFAQTLGATLGLGILYAGGFGMYYAIATAIEKRTDDPKPNLEVVE